VQQLLPLTDQSDTFLKVKNSTHVNQSVKTNRRKDATRYTRMRLLSRVRFVVSDAQFRTAAIETKPNRNEGKETTHIKFC